MTFPSLCMHYVKEMIEKINGSKNEKCIIFLIFFLVFLRFWLQNYFDMYFGNLIICITSLLYRHALLYQPIYTFTRLFSMTWIFIFQKREKKSKHLKPTYLRKYSTKIKQKIKSFKNAIIILKIDKIIVEEV